MSKKQRRPTTNRINPFEDAGVPRNTLRKPPEESSWLTAPLTGSFTPTRAATSAQPRRGSSYSVSVDLFTRARAKKRRTRTSLSSVIGQGFRLWIAEEWQPAKRATGDRSAEPTRSSSFAVDEALYNRASQLCEDSGISMTSLVEQILEKWVNEK